MPKTYFITAIGTDCGKTFVSAVLTEALQADYWKPVQAGLPRDTDTIAALLTNSKSKLHTEAYLLTQPLSPHAAAKIDSVVVDLAAIQKPQTSNHLIIEGAGGLLVPLNEKDFVIDLALQFQAEVILVVNFYLGSINHTLLSLAVLQQKEQQGLKVKGLLFNGKQTLSSREIILKHSPYPLLGSIDKAPICNAEVVKEYADKIDKELNI